MWAVQGLYVVAELVVAARADPTYSLVADTISALGVDACASAGGSCSPWSGLLNASFIGFGVLLALGSLLVPRTPSGAAARTTTVLWVVSGLGSIGTGLLPLDTEPVGHLLASTPIFVAQPAALLVTAAGWRTERPRLATAALIAGVVTAAAATCFLFGVGGASSGGLLERLAIWPTYVWLTVAGLVLLPEPRRRLAE